MISEDRKNQLNVMHKNFAPTEGNIALLRTFINEDFIELENLFRKDGTTSIESYNIALFLYNLFLIFPKLQLFTPENRKSPSKCILDSDIYKQNARTIAYNFIELGIRNCTTIANIIRYYLKDQDEAVKLTTITIKLRCEGVSELQINGQNILPTERADIFTRNEISNILNSIQNNRIKVIFIYIAPPTADMMYFYPVEYKTLFYTTKPSHVPNLMESVRNGEMEHTMKREMDLSKLLQHISNYYTFIIPKLYDVATQQYDTVINSEMKPENAKSALIKRQDKAKEKLNILLSLGYTNTSSPHELLEFLIKICYINHIYVSPMLYPYHTRTDFDKIYTISQYQSK